MKRIVRVNIEKEIEVELTPSVLGNMTEEEYLSTFRSELWHVNNMEDVVRYAASCAATYGEGYSHDGIGLVDRDRSRYPDLKQPNVIFKILDENIEIELVD